MLGRLPVIVDCQLYKMVRGRGEKLEKSCEFSENGVEVPEKMCYNEKSYMVG